MRCLLLLSVSVICLSQGIIAQSMSNRIHYQASIRDNAGRPMASRTVAFRMEVVDSLGTKVFYAERHSVTTDVLGVASLAIGGGTVLSGSYAAIPWSAGRRYLRTAVDTAGGASYVVMGTSEMLSVPYAMYAKTAGETTEAHTKGTRNLALVEGAATSVTTGRDNTAIGYQSLATVKTGEENVAIGTWAGQSLEGNRNVAIGMNAMRYSTVSEENVAVGAGSLTQNRAGSNTAVGSASLSMNTTGYGNVAMGREAMYTSETSCCSVAIGANAMGSISNVDHCVMIGYEAGRNVKGSHNVGIGSNALNGATGNFNTAVGNASLERNTGGSRNTAIGQYALSNNILADNNTAMGYAALVQNKTGYNNAAFGIYALDENVSGYDNAAFGKHALQTNSTGNGNTSVGAESMYNSTIGTYNTALGYQSLYNTLTGSSLTSVGAGALRTNTTGSGLTALGFQADVASGALSNATVIGEKAVVSTSHTMSFGNGLVTKWAFGLPTTSHALQVGSNASNGNGAYLTVGGTWTNASSRALKDRFSDVGSEELLAGLRELWIPKWSYRGTGEVHLGPMAEQFHALFGLGVPGDDAHISTVDAAGVALRAAQALQERLDESERQRADLEVRLRRVEEMLAQVLGKSVDGAGRIK